MTILTETRAATPRTARDRVDALAVVALSLAVAVALLGLVLTSHPVPDADLAGTAVTLIGP